MASISGDKEPPPQQDGRGGKIVKMGYLKKLKTMKKKFFILRAAESSENSSRLEYYDNEKKWRNNQPPKRVIALKNCFNINRRVDTKHKHVIALYTKDDCFCLVLDSEEELEDWLTALLSLQRGEDVVDGEQPKPTFEHVWQVVVQKRGLGSSRSILGTHLLCLTDKTLSLVKMTPEENAETYEFSLMSIRRCGHSECFFYMEVGRSSCTGAGDLWMQVEDNNIAENMHDAILNSMSNNGSKEELAPKSRTRSSSATESSKPGSATSWKQSHGTASVRSLSSAAEDAVKMSSYVHKTSLSHSEQIAAYVMPDTGASPQSHVFAGSLPGSSHLCHHYNRPVMHLNQVFAVTHPSQRRHSVSAMSVSAGSNGSSTATTGPSHQRTYSFPLSEPEPSSPWDTRRASTGRMGKRSGNSIRSTTAGRERSDSMPTRARTTSEGHHLPHPHTTRTAHLIPGHGPNRPLSMYARGISYSPPVGSSPVSPASGACSTDSAGSSLSIDDGEAWGESCTETNISLGRYGHSLTPDEPVIFEENCDDYVSIGVEGETQLQDTISPEQTSLSGSSSVPQRKFSPSVTGVSLKSGSPSQASYLEVYSSCGSSPLDGAGNFLSGSAGITVDGNRSSHGHNPSSVNHSRGSSFAEDTSGYLPMVAPSSFTDDTSLSLDHNLESHISRKHVSDEFSHSHMSPASSCSVTSGTPSTDLRFSEYHLEKVSSFFTPSEEEEERPARAYSVGSRPENTKKSNKVETVNQCDVSRVRAFSVGSRTAKGGRSTSHRSPNEHRPMRRHVIGQGLNLTPPSLHHLHSNPSSGKKSLSAPLLSNSWSGSANFRHLHGSHSSVEPMDDLMEMDFTDRNTRSTKSSSFSSKTSKAEISTGLSSHRERSSPHSGSPSSHYLNGLMDTVRLPSVASMKPPISSSHLDTRTSISGGVHVTSPPNISSNTLSPLPLSSDTQTNDTTSPYVPMKNGVVISPYVPMKCGSPLIYPETNVDSSVPNGSASNSPCDTNSVCSTLESDERHAMIPFIDNACNTAALLNAGGNISTNATASRNLPGNNSLISQRKDSVESVKMNSFSPPSSFVNPRKLSNASLDSNTHSAFDKNSIKSHLSNKTDHFDDSKYDSDNEYHLPDSTVFNDFSKPDVGPYVEMKPGPGLRAMRKSAQIYQNGVDAHISSSKSRSVLGNRSNMSPVRKKVVETDTVQPSGEGEDSSENTGGRSIPPRTPPVDTPQPKKTPDGYVEMWPGGSKPSQKSPLETYRPQVRLDENEYMSINFENKSGGRRERRRRDRTRYSSQPIVINPSNVVNGFSRDGSSSAGVVFTASGASGGKFFSNTSPKAPPGFLPIDGGVFSVNPGHSPFSSLRRSYTGTENVRPIGSSIQQNRPEANGEVVTPTGSNGAIFPLSPGSPIKPFPIASSQVLKQSNSSSVQGVESSYESSSKCPVDATSGTVMIYSPTDPHSLTPDSSATTPESGSSSEQPTPVNAEVSNDILRRGTDSISDHSEVSGDYAVMRPVPVPCPPRTHEAARKISAPAFVGSSRSGGIDNYLRKHFSNLNLSSPSLNSNGSSGAGSSFSHHQGESSTVHQPVSNLNGLPVTTPRVITSSSLSGLLNKEATRFNKNTAGSESFIPSVPVESPSCGTNIPKDTSSAKTLFTLRENSIEEEKNKETHSSSNENCCLMNGDTSEYVSLSECSTPRSPVSNERVLHYASLDLEDTGSRSPRGLTTQSSLTESSTSSSSPNPVQGSSCNDRFTYAEIDFKKSENLKSSSKKQH